MTGVRFAEAKQREAERRKALRSTAKLTIVQSIERDGGKPGEVNWDQMDQYGSPVISFEPGSKHALAMRSILGRDQRDKKHRKLAVKIGREFGRIYCRYRRSAERRRSLLNGHNYRIGRAEMKFAIRAGVSCVMKGVTPRQVLEYWDARIGEFTDLQIIPLAFLTPNNVDTVACASINSTRKKKPGDPSGRTPDRKHTSPVARNSFSETDGLDARLRRGLEEAGFKTQVYNDRYMMTVQHTAMSLARGKRIFVGEGQMKAMILWAVENLYR